MGCNARRKTQKCPEASSAFSKPQRASYRVGSDFSAYRGLVAQHAPPVLTEVSQRSLHVALDFMNPANIEMCIRNSWINGQALLVAANRCPQTP